EHDDAHRLAAFAIGVYLLYGLRRGGNFLLRPGRGRRDARSAAGDQSRLLRPEREKRPGVELPDQRFQPAKPKWGIYPCRQSADFCRAVQRQPTESARWDLQQWGSD